MRRARWSVLVADDEPAARRGVRQLLAAFPDFAVVGECRDGREVLAALDRLTPDVLFLDIQMPEIDGFEVIRRRTPERMPAVVFLTAYDQFAMRAFEAEAHDYLVKPVSEARFAATIKRLARRLDAGEPRARPRRARHRRVDGPRRDRAPPARDRLDRSRRQLCARLGQAAEAICCVNRWVSWNGGFARMVSRARTARRSSGWTASARCETRAGVSSPCSRAARTSRSRAAVAPLSRQPSGRAIGSAVARRGMLLVLQRLERD